MVRPRDGAVGALETPMGLELAVPGGRGEGASQVGMLTDPLCLSKLCLCLHLKPKLLKQKLVRRYGLVVGAVLSLTVGL